MKKLQQNKENDNQRIKKPNVIFCEGIDAKMFVIWYLVYLKAEEDIFEDFQVIDFGGNEELPARLQEDLPNYPGYERLKSLLIIRDAERDYNAAIQSIQSALKTANFPVPQKPHNVAEGVKPNSSQNIKVAFTLFPTLSGNPKNGTLEDMLVDILAEVDVENVLKKVETFVNDLQTIGRNFGHMHKSKLHAYFAITDENAVDEFQNNSYIGAKVGEAARDGAFNFDCKPMNNLKSLLLKIMC
ncbi:MAG: hypothetical protein FWG68_01165 [Defluviitaleaceae bacterium]|nr:hypothetical protein [Defluviitaleaceae bacterium]